VITAILLACTGDTALDDTLVLAAGEDQWALVGEPVALGQGSEGETFTWYTGDGAVLDGDVVAHSYGAPGHYTASLTGTSQSGSTRTEQVRITVTWPLLDEPPRTSSSVVSDGERVFAVLPDFAVVAVVDRASRTLLGHWDTCGHPRSLSLHQGELAVACQDDALDRFDAATGERLERIDLPWGARPFGVVHTDSGLAATTWLGLWQEGTLDETTRDLRGLAWSDGALLWSRHRSPDDGGRWFMDGVEGVFGLDPGPDSDTDARGLPTYLQRIAVRPDGRAAVFPGLKANIERGLVRDGLPLTHETTTRADLWTVPLVDGEPLVEPRFDNRDLASAAAFSPRGEWLYVAHVGARIVDVLDPFSMMRAGGLQQVGDGVDGLVAFDDELWALARFDRTLVVATGQPNTLQIETTVDLLGTLAEVLDPQVLAGQRIFYGANDRRMSLDSYLSCASCHLDGEHDGRTWDFTSRGEGLRNTKALFGMAGEPPLHWSANFDEVQDFERDIRESMGGTGFLSEADAGATADPFGLEKAGLSPDLDALAAYVASLETPRSPWAEAEGVDDGRALFDAAGCGGCHSGERLTDSTLTRGSPVLYDVGTLTSDSGDRLGGPLDGLDTPELVGVFFTAPYLHDGSADTLRARFLVDEDDRHGATSALSSAELDLLETYLLSLE
jgi:hypothetical protein